MSTKMRALLETDTDSQGMEEQKLAIAMFHTTLPEPGRKVGGVELAVHRLANEMAKTDNVTVFSLSNKPEDAIYNHVKLFEQHSWLAGKLPRISILPLLLNFIDFSEFDILNLHGDDWFYVNRKVATVRTMNGSSLRECMSATSLKRKIVMGILYPLEHLSVHLSTSPLALGSDTASLYGIPKIIDYGVNQEVFHPGPKTPFPQVTYIGTWEGRKRGKFLYDIFVNQIVPKLPEARLCMISDYCPDHPNVIKEVFPSDEVLAQRYREGWVFAYPSTYEGFGLPYAEALSSGTAVLASPNSGAEHILQHGKYGKIVDDEHFGTTLLELLQNEAEIKQMESLGLERAKDLSWQNCALVHRNHFKETIEKNRATKKCHS